MSKKQKRSVIQKLWQGARHFLVPHRGNHYRPHAIRRRNLLTLLCALAMLQAGYNVVKTGDVLGQQTRIEAARLLAQTNAARREHLRQPLKLSPQLAEAAFLKAKDMFAKNYWAHEAPDGMKPWKWLAEAGYNYSTAGENLARGFTTEDDVIKAWLDSPAHRSNMLKMMYQDVGFAVVEGQLEGKATTLVVALYAAPAEAAVAAATFAPAVPEAMHPLARFSSALQLLNPLAFGSIILLSLAAMIALLAHAYRHKLPEHIRWSWRRHHGAYKAAGLVSLVIFIIAVSIEGQI